VRLRLQRIFREAAFDQRFQPLLERAVFPASAKYLTFPLQGAGLPLLAGRAPRDPLLQLLVELVLPTEP